MIALRSSRVALTGVNPQLCDNERGRASVRINIRKFIFSFMFRAATRLRFDL
jgi:hypothetical protein